jgi:hypothetical protein
MFPLQIRLPINLLNFTFIYFGLQALARVSPIRVSWRAVAGALTVQLLWFLIRVYDELKDSTSDVAHARSGDARFINRPLVTGRVELNDIKVLRWWVSGLLFALNLPLGFPFPFVGLLVAFGYISLSYKWFFWPKLKDHVILVFLTHIPNALVIELYTLTVYVREFGTAGLGWSSVTLLLALWAQVAAFEFSYKIRVPQDETTLQTYSKALGWKVATLVTVAFLVGAVACALSVSLTAGFAWPVAAVLLAGAVWAIGGCMLFRFFPSRQRLPLTNFTGSYWYVSCLAVSVSALWRYGLAL